MQSRKAKRRQFSIEKCWMSDLASLVVANLSVVPPSGVATSAVHVAD